MKLDKEHLKDIDFRTRQQRNKNAIMDMKEWYLSLYKSRQTNDSDRLQGQMTMLAAVLWLLLPEKEYKQLTKLY